MKKLEYLRDDEGFIDISTFNIEKLNNSRHVYTIEIDNDKYYFKEIDKLSSTYNELIAEEIANDFNIPHIHYDIAVYDGNIGSISKNFLNKDDEYISMNNVLNKIFKDNKNHNNLTDIWDTFSILLNSTQTQELMSQLINIFIFDILIANNDRHDENYGIIKNNNSITLSPIFDNSCMLSEISLYDEEYAITVDMDTDNNLSEFLNTSSKEYIELLKSKLWIIEESNIDKILNRVEKRINREIEDKFKKEIKKKFSIQLNNINTEINNNIKKSYIK